MWGYLCDYAHTGSELAKGQITDDATGVTVGVANYHDKAIKGIVVFADWLALLAGVIVAFASNDAGKLVKEFEMAMLKEYGNDATA